MLERMSAYVSGRFQDFMPAEPDESRSPAVSPQEGQDGDGFRAGILDAGGPQQSVWRPNVCKGMDAAAGAARQKPGEGGARLVAEAEKHVGKSRAEMGLDCSGFIKHVARLGGAAITARITAPGPNGCTQMFGSFPKVGAHEARTGDLVYFNTLSKEEMARPENAGKVATHVGILVVNEDGSKEILHMTKKGVRLNSFAEKAVAGPNSPTWGATVVGYNRPVAAGGAD